MSREQLIRETAYAIWEAEGQPEGQDQDHWTRAEQLAKEQVVEDQSPKKSRTKKAAATVADPLAVSEN
jgi:hypothetical protein